MRTETTDLTTWTPAEIDRALEPIHNKIGELWFQESVIRGQMRKLERAGGQQSTMDRYVSNLEKLTEQQNAAEREAKPYWTEFKNRGGWTRAYKVSGGHVHSSDHCPTCHKMGQVTPMHLMADWSGRTQAEIVDAAGEEACTVCYPDAPVAKGQPCQILTADDVATAKAAADRKAKIEENRIKREAKAITRPDGSPLKTHYYSGTITTIAAAELEYVDLATMGDWATNNGPGIVARREADMALILEALVAKKSQTTEEVQAHLDGKVARRRKSNGR